MALTAGTRLGPYEIAAQIGEGGMGQVYRATDTNLKRQVAIKVLPESVANDPDRLARFQREAEVLAALNHPKIAQIYGLERSTGITALVMELVEGPSLADRIAQGAIPVDEALAIARQIAEALDAAHEQGIVHRDLKPANIKVREDGTVKVLDFGLAKSKESGAMPPGVTQSPTMPTPAMTQSGVILGTAAYMSPEQARGKTVDKRADIWAFGCVLYESLAGKRAFEGTSTAETMVQVLTAEIDWAALPGGVPAPVRYLLTRCLDREARRRLRDIGEARLILEDPAGRSSPVADQAGPPRSLRRIVLAWTAGALLVGGSLGTLAAWRVVGSPDPPVITQTSILLAEGDNFTFTGRRVLTIAPSGRKVAYTAGPGLWLRSLGDREAHLVTGIGNDARSPFFSFDGQWIGYYASGALWKVSVTGGAPVRLVDAVNPWSASWGTDGTILYGQGPAGIWRVPDTGGKATQVVTAGTGESMLGPQALPGGAWVLFTLLPAGSGLWDQAQIVAQSLSTSERVLLLKGGRDARFLPTGHLVFALRDALLGARFDVKALKLGPAIPLVNGVADALNISGAAQFDVADSGALVFIPRSIPDRLALTWVDRSGRDEMIPGEPRAYRHPRVSPDGSRIAVAVQDGDDTDVWVGDRRGTFTPVTLGAGDDGFPQWSGDGSRIAFFSARNGGGLFARPAGNTGPDQLLVSGMEWRPSAWTAAGQLLYEQLRGAQVEVLAPAGGKAKQLTLVEDASYFDMLHPTVSPNGAWLAYHSRESGALEVYVRPFPNIEAGRTQVSTTGGYSPAWSRDGSELFYIEGIGGVERSVRMSGKNLMAVAIKTRPTLAASTPQRLFSLEDYVAPNPEGRSYDVGPDGRFLMLKDVTPRRERVREQIVVVQHWTEELKRIVPTK